MTVDTLCVQGGWSPKKGEPRQVPVYSSTTFRYETSEQMADLFDLKASGYFYTRLANPTNDQVAKKIAALEGGVAAILTSSGQAARRPRHSPSSTSATPATTSFRPRRSTGARSTSSPFRSRSWASTSRS